MSANWSSCIIRHWQSYYTDAKLEPCDSLVSTSVCGTQWITYDSLVYFLQWIYFAIRSYEVTLFSNKREPPSWLFCCCLLKYIIIVGHLCKRATSLGGKRSSLPCHCIATFRLFKAFVTLLQSNDIDVYDKDITCILKYTLTPFLLHGNIL